MRIDSLARHFDAIGARVKCAPFDRGERRWRYRRMPAFSIDILTDRNGEFFKLDLGDDAPEFEVLQVLPRERHLLLLTSTKRRFLCGHDERHWFVAEIDAPVSTVREAKRSLMPPAVRDRAGRVNPRETEKRRNGVFKRQGEWFFVPVDREFDPAVIHRGEPLQRTPQSKPHVCEELVRLGGTTVYLIGALTLTEEDFGKAVMKNPKLRSRVRGTRVINPEIYARGAVRHADHATIRLEGWHRVMINSEITTSNLAYLD